MYITAVETVSSHNDYHKYNKLIPQLPATSAT